MTLDIDPEAWEMAYGTPLNEVREDVRASVIEAVESRLVDSGEGFGHVIR
jgi:hypothetical protein